MTGGWLQQLSSFSLSLFRLVQLSQPAEFSSVEVFFSAFLSGIAAVLPADVGLLQADLHSLLPAR